MVLGEEARENGLKFSLLERLQNMYKQLGGLAVEHMVSLNTNYRCRQELVKIPNELFYDSKINTAHCNALQHPRAAYPLIFVCSGLTSKVNSKLEAQLLLEQVSRFAIHSWPLSWGEKDLKKICVTTASRTQVSTNYHTASVLL